MQVQIGHIPPEGRRLSSLGGAALAAFALLRLRWGVIPLIAGCAILGAASRLLA